MPPPGLHPLHSTLLLHHLHLTLQLTILTPHPSSPTCTALNLIYDSTSFLSSTLLPLPSSLPPDLTPLNILLPLNEAQPTLKKLRHNAKHRLHCSLVLLHPLKDTPQEQFNHLASIINFPGSPHKVFFLLIAGSTPDDLDTSELLEVSKSTRQIQHLVLGIINPSAPSLHFFLRTSTRNRLIHQSEIKYSGDGSVEETRFEERHLVDVYRDQSADYEGEVMPVKVCPVCEPAFEIFKATGRWTDYMICAMWEVSLMVNATLEVEPVFSLPGDGTNDDGQWDDFIGPLIDGSAAISAIIRPSPSNLHTVFFSTAGAYFDSVSFVTAPRTLVGYTSLLRLLQPLNLQIWLLTLLSILAMFLLLETSLAWERAQTAPRALCQHNLPRHEAFQTLAGLLKPLVDQNGLSVKSFARGLQVDVSRFLAGVWFIMVITLGSAYKSKAIALLVLPTYLEPPDTFQQLLESDYDVGAIFYASGIRNDFLALNSSLSRGLDERIVEFSYTDSECYDRIFDGHRACVGYKEVFDTVGAKFMRDVRKRKMYHTSSEAFFFFQANVGVSKYYPKILHPHNSILRGFIASGVVHLMLGRAKDRMAEDGRKYALSYVDRKPNYSGNKWNSEEEEGLGDSMWQITELLLKLLALCAGGATVALVAEIGFSLYHRHFRQTRVTLFLNEFPVTF